MLTLTIASLLSPSASVIVGNPASGVKHTGGPSTYVHKVFAHPCTGGTVAIPIYKTLSAGQMSAFTFPSNVYCSVDVRVRWSPGAPLSTVPVAGFSSLDITNGAPAITLGLNAATQKASL